LAADLQRPSQWLMLPIGKDTLLRAVRGGSLSGGSAARVIGIDEWAWRRRQRYGTLICDLEQRRVIELLPDREPATVKAWLSANPGIRVVARDRAGGYAGAVAEAAPQALQVADRWHLMENASAAFLAAVRGMLGPIRRVLGSGRPAAASRRCGCRAGRTRAIQGISGRPRKGPAPNAAVSVRSEPASRTTEHPRRRPAVIPGAAGPRHCRAYAADWNTLPGLARRCR
jgi:hypothetical protein